VADAARAAEPTMAVTRYPPIRDQIAAIIRTAIIDVVFVPGQLLIERELCVMTGASRPSVREALRQLEAEGLVESRNGRGTVVRDLSLEEATAVYEVRAELEGLAARLFCLRATDEQQQGAADAVVELRRAITGGAESKAILQAQSAFYAILFAGAGNDVLNQTVRGLQVRVAQLRARTLAVPSRALESLAEFEEIATELAARRPGPAQRAAAKHVHRAAAVMAASSRDGAARA
jgi:DNA-binding GntR family transcriptional regulator